MRLLKFKNKKSDFKSLLLYTFSSVKILLFHYANKIVINKCSKKKRLILFGLTVSKNEVVIIFTSVLKRKTYSYSEWKRNNEKKTHQQNQFHN